MLTFARKTEVNLTAVSVNDIISDLSKMLQETFPKNIEIREALEKDIPFVVADSTQIHQVLLNLCVNARDAMKRGGVLTIATKPVSREILSNKFPDVSAETYIEIRITDTGIGMDAHTLQRIFDPFFTTKPIGAGTGLGLSVVYGIVHSHGGYIDVVSKPGEGTTFFVYLPAGEFVSFSAQEVPYQKDESLTGNETILIVEDEDDLRNIVCDILQTHGYKVFSAGNGEEALELYTSKCSEIAAVLSDIGLPKMSGEYLFRRVRIINPNAKVIVASGFIEPSLKDQLFREGVNEFVSKPYKPQDVLRTLRRVLSAEG